MILTVLGLALFETISSIDNAIINAEVLHTMQPKARKWFLLWGILFAVFIIRGILPWLIVWATVPSIGPWDALVATFSNNPSVVHAIEASSPILLMGGGMFLILLFFNWLFLEEKNIGLKHERFFLEQGVWFYAVASLILLVIVWYSLHINTMMAFGAVVGSTAFFIVHGFKYNAEKSEKQLMTSTRSDVSKIFYLEVIDATFSIDGVLGAFAFTLSVPIILIGNGIGALIVRNMTIGNIERIKKYMFLKNGAMYSILVLGTIMVFDSFGIEMPAWISPVSTFLIVGYFFQRSRIANKLESKLLNKIS